MSHMRFVVSAFGQFQVAFDAAPGRGGVYVRGVRRGIREKRLLFVAIIIIDG